MHPLIKHIRNFLAFVLVLLIIIPSYTQHNSKALKFINKAEDAFAHKDYKKSGRLCKKAINIDTGFVKSYVLLASIFENQDKLEEALFYYKKASKFNSGEFPDLAYIIADLCLKLRKYDEAVLYAQNYIESNGKKVDETNRIIELAKFRKNAYKNPKEVLLKKIKNSIPDSDEYVNSISLDGKELYFTIKRIGDSTQTGDIIYEEDIYASQLHDDSICSVKEITLPLSFSGRVGAASVSADGRYLFFTVGYHKKGLGNCDLYYKKLNNVDTTVYNLGTTINTKDWDAQACFSADGKTLFFASKRKGGSGGSDIWISELNENGYWTKPQNPGSHINSKGDEMAPFIHHDTKTLYFSSTGHIGMGGYDLFVCEYSNKTWSKAENLGYPINTERDEINIVIAPNGEDAYISKKDEDFDIYYFKLDSGLAQKVNFITGKVIDSHTGKTLQAKIELTDLASESLFAKAQSFENGTFKIVLPQNNHFAFHVSKKGYLFYSKSYNEFNHRDTLYIELIPSLLNSKVQLNNVFFDTDKYELKPKSKTELDKLVQFLFDNPHLSIEIGGHTDDVGDKEYNQILSEKRAKAVYDYLIQYNVKPQRINYKGYGEILPLKPNNSNENRSQNRRTEFRIVKIEVE